LTNSPAFTIQARGAFGRGTRGFGLDDPSALLARLDPGIRLLRMNCTDE